MEGVFGRRVPRCSELSALDDETARAQSERQEHEEHAAADCGKVKGNTLESTWKRGSVEAVAGWLQSLSFRVLRFAGEENRSAAG
jgi:hypothetical protein